MSSTERIKKLGGLLRKEAPEILSEWKGGARKLIPGADELTTPMLTNELSNIIENLAEAFEVDASVYSSDQQENKELGKAHGNQRVMETEFSLAEVFREYALFRQIVTRKLFPAGSVKSDAELLLHQFIDEAVQASIVEYVKLEKAKS